MTLITDTEVVLLKPWLARRLAIISEADSDILSDYVIALLQAEDSESALRINAAGNLVDFLGANANKFINEVLQAIKTKSYAPKKPTEKSQTEQDAITPSSAARSNHNNTSGTIGKKRTRAEANSSRIDWSPRNGHDERRGKQARREVSSKASKSSSYRPQSKPKARHPDDLGGNYRRSPDRQPAREAPLPQSHSPRRESKRSRGQPSENVVIRQPDLLIQEQPVLPIPAFEIPALGSRPFDANEALQALMTLTAMGMPLPIPQIMPTVAASTNSTPTQRPWIPSNKPCRIYDSTGSCSRGVTCVFRHVDKDVEVREAQQEQSLNGAGSISSANNKSAIARSNAKNNGRAQFSGSRQQGDHLGLTAVVVEHIPEESFEYEKIRNFFSEFGEIKNIVMRANSHLAIVEYEDIAGARAAMGSPKVIFDNRFIKVFWYIPGKDDERTNGLIESEPMRTKQEGSVFDREKLEKDAAEAQRKHEARKILLAETENKRQALIARQQAIEKEKAEEIQKMKDLCAAKGKPIPPEIEQTTSSNDTATLLAQLKALEEEAQSLGIDADTWSNSEVSYAPSYGYRGRGSSYRGWRGYSVRGRGGQRGGHYIGTTLAGGAYNLDNRPKKVLIEGTAFDSNKEESLRQVLSTFGEYVSVEPAEDQKSRIVTFKDRGVAEAFFFGARDISSLGELTFSWVTSALSPPTARKHEEVQMIDANSHGNNRVISRGNSSDLADRDDREEDQGEDYEWIT